jgi:FkbM family methyltransferase
MGAALALLRQPWIRSQRGSRPCKNLIGSARMRVPSGAPPADDHPPELDSSRQTGIKAGRGRRGADAFQMNPAAPALGRLASAINGLGVWRREQWVWGSRMRAETFDRTLYLWLHRRGFMGASERVVLGKLVKPGMTAVDVGANLGLYSLLLAGLVGTEGRVISFEPDPELFSLLRANCGANNATQVEVHPMALGSAPDRMVLNRLTLNSGDNHLGPSGRTVFRRPLEVEVKPLDALMPGLRPDFVKVDVQGWELKVLRGMESTLRSAGDAGIYLELWPDGLRRAGDSPAELYGFVRGLGFRFYSCGDWRELDETAFLALAGAVRGMNHVDLFASRTLPENCAPAR